VAIMPLTQVVLSHRAPWQAAVQAHHTIHSKVIVCRLTAGRPQQQEIRSGRVTLSVPGSRFTFAIRSNRSSVQHSVRCRPSA